jgi:hypothetical protein
MKVTFGTVDVGYGLLIYFPKLCLATKWRPLGLKDFERDPTGDFATGVDYQGISDFNVTGFADCANRLGHVAKDIRHGIEVDADGHPQEMIVELASEGGQVSVFGGGVAFAPAALPMPTNGEGTVKVKPSNNIEQKEFII